MDRKFTITGEVTRRGMKNLRKSIPKLQTATGNRLPKNLSDRELVSMFHLSIVLHLREALGNEVRIYDPPTSWPQPKPKED